MSESLLIAQACGTDVLHELAHDATAARGNRGTTRCGKRVTWGDWGVYESKGQRQRVNCPECLKP
jgi:hypothetical protein